MYVNVKDVFQIKVNRSNLIWNEHFRVYSESHTEEPAISLFIKRLTSEDAGLYKCSAIYAANQEIVASVSVSIISKSVLIVLSIPRHGYLIFQLGSPGLTHLPNSTLVLVRTTNWGVRCRLILRLILTGLRSPSLFLQVRGGRRQVCHNHLNLKSTYYSLYNQYYG